MNFFECVSYCLDQHDFVKEFNRLWDCKLGIDDRTPIERIIDKTTGYDGYTENQMKYMGIFVDFVYETVWTRMELST